MTRGTFANVRIKNLMAPARGRGHALLCHAGLLLRAGGDRFDLRGRDGLSEGGTAVGHPGRPEYGTAARGTGGKGNGPAGVRAVVAQSSSAFTARTGRMGVLPLQFPEGTSAQSLKLDGTERFDVLGLDGKLKPQRI
jgi:aconitate hydratase